uniref:Uncharacterized protein n=1 Tax=Avena sativa TaxID=4498 RepID=A0ACD6AJ16_AVESA
MPKHKDITGRARGAEMDRSQGNDHGNDGGEGKKMARTTTFPKTKLKLIMGHALEGHPQAKIDEDARDAVDRCVLEFANLVTTTAAEQCRKDSRKIMNGDDLIKAMEILGFHHYVGPLNVYLLRYRESKGRVEMPPPATGVVTTGEMEAPAPPQPFGCELGQQPPCDVTELGLHTDVYAAWSRAAEASTSSPMPSARDD